MRQNIGFDSADGFLGEGKSDEFHKLKKEIYKIPSTMIYLPENNLKTRSA